MLEELDVLKGPGNAPTGYLVRWNARDVDALEEQPSAGHVVDTADQVEDGCLAGAVRPDDCEDFPFRHIERNAVDRLDAAKPDREVARLEDGHCKRSVRI